MVVVCVSGYAFPAISSYCEFSRQHFLLDFTRNLIHAPDPPSTRQQLIPEKQLSLGWKLSGHVEARDTRARSTSEGSANKGLLGNADRKYVHPEDCNLQMGELETDTDPNHKSGYVAVLGKPNVGKSTLVNQMIGQKISIVTHKPQTTRHRILALCSEPTYQMILYDTPGVIQKKMHKLDSMMLKNVCSAACNADCVLVVVDACHLHQNVEETLDGSIGTVKNKFPILVVLNKIDQIKPAEIARRLEWYRQFINVDDVIPVSAKYNYGVEDIKNWILSKLPFGPAYYPKDIVSQHPERFFVTEIVREKIFMQYRHEVPYACQVNVKEYISRSGSKDYINVEILVEKHTQKTILIGTGGKAIKLLATAARLDIEDFLQKDVYLKVDVKVKEKWRQDVPLLKRYGYGGHIQVL